GGLSVVQCCHFPLIPYSNRIENGRFTFGGAVIRLRENVAGSPHALHGHGWQAVWRVTEHSPASCTLSFDRAPAPDWPWKYRGTQTIAVAGGALNLDLAIENLDAAVMPCGLGFHPFLPRSGGARLALEADQVWDGCAGTFPRRRVDVPAALEFRHGPRVGDRQGTDHCFDGWRGAALVSDERSACAWRIEGCEATRFVIVYIPANAEYFCVEPVTHAVNAMNQPDAAESGLWTLKPRETRRITMSIRPAGPRDG
ncbi:MAG: aldose 1-epimerase, partial [Steroidobacteraceae bacterium]